MPSRVLHEINVIGTLNLLAAAGTAGSSVRQVVVKSSTHIYGAAETDPTWFREEDDAHQPGADPPGALAPRGRGAGPGLRRRQPPPGRLGPAVRQRPRHRHHHPDQPQPAAAAPALHRRLRPAGPVRRGGRRGPGARVRHRPSDPRACSTWPVRASSPGARWPPSAAAFLLPLPPFRPRAFVAPLRRLGHGRSSPRRSRGCVRYGRGVDTSRLREAGFEYRYTSAGAVESFARANNLRRATGSGEPRLPLRAGRGAVLPPLPGGGAGHRRLGVDRAPGVGGGPPRAVSSASTRRPATRAP